MHQAGNGHPAAAASASTSPAQRPRRGARYALLLSALLLLSTATRLVHLDADPPADLNDGAVAIYTDEGYKTYHARNQALFGNWLWHPDDQYRFWLRQSPASLNVHALWYRVTGRVDVVCSRLLHVLCGLLALLLWASAVRRELGDRHALLSTAVLGLAHVGSMYARLVFLENLLLLVYVGLIWLLCRARPRWWHLLGALALLAFGLGTKATVLAFVAATGAGGVGILVHRLTHRLAAGDTGRQSRWLQRLLLGGLALVAVGYLALLLLPQLATSMTPLASRNPLVGPALLLRNVTYDLFTPKLPVLFLLALWGAAELVTDYLRGGPRPPAPLRVVCTAWLLLGFGLLSLFEGNADRNRYYLVLLPPIALLAADVLLRHLGARPAPTVADPAPPLPTPPLARWLGGLFAVFAVVHLGIGLHHQLTSPADRLALAHRLLAGPAPAELLRVLGPLAVGAALFLGAVFGARLAWRRGRRRTVMVVLACLALAIQGSQYLRWIADPPHAMQRARTDLVRRLPADAVLAGQWAPALALGTTLHALHLHYAINLRDGQLRRLQPTHLLLTEGRAEENDLLAAQYPGLLRPEAELTRYHIAEYTLRLYQLDWSTVGRLPAPAVTRALPR